MAHKITAEWTQLMEDSFETSCFYFRKSIEKIDSEFGKGYAKANPLLIAAFMQSSSTENAGVTIGACIQDLERIATEIEGLTAMIETKEF